MDRERDIRELLTYGCRIVAMDGQGDLIWGHLTARNPHNSESLYMKPADIGLDEMHVDDIIEVDLNGNKRAGTGSRHSEVFIHTQIMRTRDDVQCVVHTHAPWAVAFGSLNRPLVPVGHEGSLFAEGLPVFTQFTDLVVTGERGQAVAEMMGEHNALLLQNHGIVTAGRSVAEAVMTAVFLEKACRIQMMALAAGGPEAWTPPEEARIKKERIYEPRKLEVAFQYCIRRLQTRDEPIR